MRMCGRCRMKRRCRRCRKSRKSTRRRTLRTGICRASLRPPLPPHLACYASWKQEEGQHQQQWMKQPQERSLRRVLLREGRRGRQKQYYPHHHQPAQWHQQGQKLLQRQWQDSWLQQRPALPLPAPRRAQRQHPPLPRAPLPLPACAAPGAPCQRPPRARGPWRCPRHCGCVPFQPLWQRQ